MVTDIRVKPPSPVLLPQDPRRGPQEEEQGQGLASPRPGPSWRSAVPASWPSNAPPPRECLWRSAVSPQPCGPNPCTAEGSPPGLGRQNRVSTHERQRQRCLSVSACLCSVSLPFPVARGPKTLEIRVFGWEIPRPRPHTKPRPTNRPCPIARPIQRKHPKGRPRPKDRPHPHVGHTHHPYQSSGHAH